MAPILMKGRGENVSTEKIMKQLSVEKTTLKPSLTPEAIKKDALERLLKAKLGTNPDMLLILETYPTYMTRLIPLFKELAKQQIPLTDKVKHAIADNLQHLASSTKLLELIGKLESKEITPDSISIKRLFDAAKWEQSITQNVDSLKDCNALDLTTFKLMLEYPQQADKITEIIINLRERAFSVEQVMDKLLNAPESIQANPNASRLLRSSTIELLNFILEHDLYFEGMVDLLLKHEIYINEILNGAKELAVANKLSGTYFATVGQNPKNALIFARNILSLSKDFPIDIHHPETKAPLIKIDNKEQLVIVSKFGLGVWFMLQYLSQADMLDAEIYQRICRHNSVLTSDRVIREFNRLPMVVKFSSEELGKMLELSTKHSANQNEIQDFIDILSEHCLLNCNNNNNNNNQNLENLQDEPQVEESSSRQYRS